MADSPTTGWAARLRLGAVAVGALVLVPALLGFAAAGSVGSTGIVFGAAMTVAGSMASGASSIRAAGPALVVAVSLGSATAGSWWWVVVVTTFAVVAGAATSRGATGAFGLVAIAATVAPPLDAARDVVLIGAFTAVGVAYAVALLRRVPSAAGGPAVVRRQPVPMAMAFGATAAVTSAIAVLVGGDHAAWIPMTALVLGIPSTTAASERARDRVTGTVAGVAVAGAFTLVGPPSPWYTVAVSASMVMAIATSGLRYRVQSFFGTLVVVLAGTRPGETIELAARRLVYTVIGVAALVIGIAVVAAADRRSRRAEGRSVGTLDGPVQLADGP